MLQVKQRFAAWVQWLNECARAEKEARGEVPRKVEVSQEAVAQRLDCSQAMVSYLLDQDDPRVVRQLKLAHRIEVESADWPDGPIRAPEWTDGTEPAEVSQ